MKQLSFTVCKTVKFKTVKLYMAESLEKAKHQHNDFNSRATEWAELFCCHFLQHVELKLPLHIIR